MISENDVQGHWRRLWLRTRDHEDTITRVHWLQSGGLFADIRIPLERPNLGDAECLADLSTEALTALLDAEGFAGSTRVQDSICTWARHINWHGESDDIDAGRLSFDASGDLIEEGIHADYAERWTREDELPNAARMLERGERRGFLVTVGERFVFALGRPDAPSSRSLIETLAKEERPDDALGSFFDCVYCLGRWESAAGHVELSTNPFLEGQIVLRKGESQVTFFHQGYSGARETVRLKPCI